MSFCFEWINDAICRGQYRVTRGRYFFPAEVRPPKPTSLGPDHFPSCHLRTKIWVINYINLFEVFEIVTDYEPMTIWGNKDFIWIQIFQFFFLFSTNSSFLVPINPVIGSGKLVLRKENEANLYLIKKIYNN